MSSYVSPYHPSQPEPVIPPFDVSTIPHEEIDDPTGNEELLPKMLKSPLIKKMVFPPVVLGCSTFGYGIYAGDDTVKSTLPLRVVRLAMRCGMNAFDTSPWYHPSEIILGNALQALGYMRGHYHLITKVGKYGPNSRDHTFEPEVVKASVARSLKRLQTDYLDVVYLHDVEYALPPPSYSGNPLDVLQTIISQPPTPTPEEAAILSGIAALRELQSAGQILQVGIAGYPLPVLLRLSLLILHTTGTPLDVVQTYGHKTVQNDALEKGYLDAFTEQAKVGRVVSAAPLAMGILTTHGGPDWHPARQIPKLWDATREASDLCKEKNTTLEDVALRFGYRSLVQKDGQKVPIVVGCTDLEQVHSTARRWNEVNKQPPPKGEEREQTEGEKQKEKEVLEGEAVEEEVRKLFAERGVQGWSWECPTDAQRSG
ncbi:hypothetical protein IAT38_007050 [Cryptococcus sp. DSM 104549]